MQTVPVGRRVPKDTYKKYNNDETTAVTSPIESYCARQSSYRTLQQVDQQTNQHGNRDTL
jgi:hypothetical protein